MIFFINFLLFLTVNLYTLQPDFSQENAGQLKSILQLFKKNIFSEEKINELSEKFNKFLDLGIGKKVSVTANHLNMMIEIRKEIDLENWDEKSLEEILNFFEEKNNLIKQNFSIYSKSLADFEKAIDLKNNFFNINEKFKNYKKKN